MDKEIELIEKLTKEIEGEKDFNKMVDKFGDVATLIKKVLSESVEAKGKVTEIIKNLDGYIEKEIKAGV